MVSGKIRSYWSDLVSVGDVGDKLYIVVSGEIIIKFPDLETHGRFFEDRYKEYSLLLEQLEAEKELARKK